jgi:multicomponent Na+:H+ antiporter subunit E
MRIVGRVALLVALWLLAWGDLSLANLLSGAAVAGGVLVAFPPGPRPPGRLRARPGGVARLAGHVASQLVISNVLMARQILSRRPEARPGVVAHRLRQPSEEVVTVMTSVIALSPGTMTVDVDSTSHTIYVHFFRLSDIAAAHAALDHLEQLVVSAIAATSGPGSAGTAEEPR